VGATALGCPTEQRFARFKPTSSPKTEKAISGEIAFCKIRPAYSA